MLITLETYTFNIYNFTEINTSLLIFEMPQQEFVTLKFLENLTFKINSLTL